MKMAIGGLLAGCLWGMAGNGLAQSTAVGGIYTCVDSQGRKLTSDRPIPECMDREQKMLNPSGTVRQKLGPSLTAAERAQQDAREKQESEERSRRIDERRRDKALLSRYPNQPVHDQARAAALAQITAISQAARQRLVELASQRKRLDEELEFYRKNPDKAPATLRRQAEEYNQNTAAQQRIILDQEEETRRVNGRFDDELRRLRQLWLSIAK
jgi:hypothetical protein